MTRLRIDADLPAKLLQLSEAADLCDEAGAVVGRFNPVFDPSRWEIIGPELSDEELERRANSRGPWYTTEEVLVHLRKVE